MKLELSIKDRLGVSLLLPTVGGFIQQELIHYIKERIRLTPEEIHEYEVHDSQGGIITWNTQKAKDKIYDFTESEINILKQGVDLLDKEERITSDIFLLCKKIRDLRPQ